MNASPAGYQIQAIWKLVPWVAATKAVAPDMCTSFFQSDADDLVLPLEWSWGGGGVVPTSLFKLQEDGQHLDTG